jgi:hypothetical protein
MMEYANVSSMTELPGYLILSTYIPSNKGGVMIFDKSAGKIFKLKKFPPCPPDTTGRRYFVNNIDGIANPAFF